MSCIIGEPATSSAPEFRISPAEILKSRMKIRSVHSLGSSATPRMSPPISRSIPSWRPAGIRTPPIRIATASASSTKTRTFSERRETRKSSALRHHGANPYWSNGAVTLPRELVQPVLASRNRPQRILSFNVVLRPSVNSFSRERQKPAHDPWKKEGVPVSQPEP